MDKNRSMVDVAYELMSKKKSAVNFFKLWEEVCQMKKFDEVHIDMNDIYTDEDEESEEVEDDVDSTIEDDYNN